RESGINIVDFESDCCPIARWLPIGMATDTDSCSAEVILDPRASHRVRAGLQLQRFLIKFSSALRVGNGNGYKCNFFDHKQTPFSFSGFSLWMTNLFPWGS